MKCFTRCALFFLMILVGGVAVLGAGAWLAADWLTQGDAPVKADHLLVLAGDPLRAVYAAELYRDGFAQDVYLTRTLRPERFRTYDELGITFQSLEDITTAVLLKKGVAARDIHFIGGQPVVSTAEEARAAREFFTKSGATRLLIVTSPYHVRRAKMVFHDTMPEIAVAVVAAPYDRLPEKWWRDQAAARQVVLEFAKTAYYLVGGRFSSSNVRSTE